MEAALRAHEGWTERPEQSCAYRLDFASGGERVVVKQYTNGTLLLTGSGAPGALLERLAATASGAGATPVAVGKPASGAGAAGTSRAPRGSSSGVDVARPFDAPWIGSDESGKGDYFGPLVACAVYADERILAILETLGVQDSKRLSDAQNRRLAGEVRAVSGQGYAEVLVPPERYNALYEQFRREGKNLNTLLAWGHVRAVQAVRERVPCDNLIVDQFADARYITSRLARAGQGQGTRDGAASTWCRCPGRKPTWPWQRPRCWPATASWAGWSRRAGSWGGPSPKGPPRRWRRSPGSSWRRTAGRPWAGWPSCTSRPPNAFEA